MSELRTKFLAAVERWLTDEVAVEAAILYGSSARSARGCGAADKWSDIDLHIITSRPSVIEQTTWSRALPGYRFCVQARKTAAGGVKKLTVLFLGGELELVLLPKKRLQVLRIAMAQGLHRERETVRAPLNVLATGLRTGFRFVKGARRWEPFYTRIVAELPGLRLSDAGAIELADCFLCQLVVVLQRIKRGEFTAAQHGLHRQLAETNFMLMRELRLRRNLPVPSYETARRSEQLLSRVELSWVQINAKLEPAALTLATWRAFSGLKSLMAELVPDWSVSDNFDELIVPFRP